MRSTRKITHKQKRWTTLSLILLRLLRDILTAGASLLAID
jgi:hypothetical protein